MKRLAFILVAGMFAFTGLGSRFDSDARCRDLAAEIVRTWFENGPILPGDIERERTFKKLGCGDAFLQVEKQRILAERFD
jgi:hypothetical protein